MGNPMCKGCLQPTDDPQRHYCNTCRPVKMGNALTERLIDGKTVVFHSKHEARRWDHLCLLVKAGLICRPLRQVPIPLCVRGQSVCRYVADFVYLDCTQGYLLVVEDAKGHRTDYYKLKARLFRAIMGFAIVEV